MVWVLLNWHQNYYFVVSGQPSLAAWPQDVIPALCFNFSSCKMIISFLHLPGLTWKSRKHYARNLSWTSLYQVIFCNVCSCTFCSGLLPTLTPRPSGDAPTVLRAVLCCPHVHCDAGQASLSCIPSIFTFWVIPPVPLSGRMVLSLRAFKLSAHTATEANHWQYKNRVTLQIPP